LPWPGKLTIILTSPVGLAGTSQSGRHAEFEIRAAACDRRAELSARLGELLTRKGLNVNASRLLFEGLEDRILLSAIPAALIASLPRITETHSGSIRPTAVGGLDIASFTLPKFDDQGGMRILVEATLVSATATTVGTLNVVCYPLEFAGTVDLTLTLGSVLNPVESNVFVVAPTPTFTFGPINLAASQMGVAINPGETKSVTILAQTMGGSQEQTVSYPDSGLNDFISSPGDSTILFEITTESSVTVETYGFTGNSYTDPLIEYTMTGEVTYVYVMLGTGEDYYQGSKYDFRKPPAAQFQPFYSGTAQPGSTLAVDVLGLGGEVLGSTSTIVDAGGNWAASFYDLGMTGEPHTVSLRQSYAGYTPLTGAGYNLRRYFSPAILGGAYASEHLTVENVLGNRAADVSMAALYSASANPITLGPTLYAYEMLPMSASPQGLH